MEAMELLKEYRRMCSDGIHFCEGCPLKNKQCLSTGIRNKTDGEFLTITSTVEQWSKEHPIITNAQKFKEVFGGEAIYAISSPNVQALKDWLGEPYKEHSNA